MSEEVQKETTIQQTQPIKKKQPKSSKGRVVKWVIIIILSVMLAGILAVGGYIGYRAYLVNQELPDISNVDVLAMADKSTIYAADETTVLAELQDKNRQPLSSLDEVSENLINATIATEDAKFYSHNGVDIFGILRAAVSIATGGNTQGGSTITMQLMRNTVLSADAQKITIDRKLGEIILALRAEQTYSKDQILLMYLNTINYGDGCYGIKTAAEHYYSKAPKDLTINESATLAGIPQAPSYLCPVTHPENSLARRNVVLSRMLATNMITKEQYQELSAQPEALNVAPAKETNNYSHPYYTSYVRQLIDEKYPDVDIYNAGWKIYTAMDVNKQTITEDQCTAQANKLGNGCIAAGVTIDPTNGYVTSIVGGPDYSTDQYNVAVSKGRPTGSSFKTFTLMACIEAGLDPYKYTVDCSSPLTIGTTTIRNFGGSSYGTRTIQSAFAISSNTGFVRLQQKVTTDKVIEMARRLGIKNADLPDITTLTLGSADITPLEMASAYSTICSGGIYMSPVVIARIEKADGTVVYDYTKDNSMDKGTRVVSEEQCGAAIKVMQTVFTSGTATGAQLSNRQPVAGKTGTSEEYRDHTLVGFTPDCVLATWIGKLDYSSTSSSLSCNSLFKGIMDQICSGKPVKEFPTYTDPSYSSNNTTTENAQTPTAEASGAPNVVGQTLSQAKSTLSKYKLTIYQEYSSTVPSGTVIRQEANGERVVLYVSKGSSSG